MSTHVDKFVDEVVDKPSSEPSPTGLPCRDTGRRGPGRAGPATKSHRPAAVADTTASAGAGFVLPTSGERAARSLPGSTCPLEGGSAIDGATHAATRVPDPDAVEFIRFCYRRRRVGWPELYDEMCAVAARGLFRGLGVDDLAAHGIGFGLFDMPALAAIATGIVAEELAPRRPMTVVITPSARRGYRRRGHRANQ